MGIKSEDADVYGQVHPIETPSLIAESLAEFHALLDEIPPKERANEIEAEHRCPELLTDDFKLMFLRCEVFHADLAVARYVKYWDKRVAAFGPEKAFEPLTLAGALRDDAAALQRGFFRIIGTKAVGDRHMIFLDPTMQDFEYSQDSMLRAVWYIYHAALEDEGTQKHGIVMINYCLNATMSHLDRTLISRITNNIQGALPMRLSGIHFCRPPLVLSTIFPLIKTLLGSRLRKRIKVHAGKEDHVWADLEKYGMTEKNLPEDIGGKVVLDHLAWLEERRRLGK